MVDRESDNDKEQIAWREHNLSQLRYFKSLSLREKIQALENMAAVVQRFEQMRVEKGFRSASEREKQN
jgi:hypothetical protein